MIKKAVSSEIIFWSILILYLMVSLVPFFALKYIKIIGFSLHYIIVGGGVFFLSVWSWMNYGKKFFMFDKWLLFLTVGLFLSLFTSINCIWTLKSLVSFLLRGILVAFITYRSIDSKKKSEIAVQVLLIGASVVCILGLIESFSGKIPIFHNLYLKHAPYYPMVFTGSNRMVSTIGHPLPLSAYLILLFPISILSLQNKKSFLNAIPFVLIISTIIFSFSRSSWIALFLGTIVYFSRRESLKVIIKNWILISVFISGLALLFLTTTRLRNTFLGRVRVLKTEIFHSHRTASYKTVWRILKDSPFLGVGLGNYITVHEKYLAPGAVRDIKTPDNMYLRLLSETGIVGMSIFFIFIFYWLYQFWKKRESELVWVIFLGVFAFLINLMSADLFYWLTTQFLFWFLMGLGARQVSQEFN